MRRYRRRTRPQYLLPFLALVGFGVFLILAFQLWGNFFPNAKGDAVFYMADGRAKVLSFGTTEWVNVYNGSKVKLGDSVKTLQGGRGVVSFYDGTAVRMDENTQVTLVDITKKDDYQEILLFLNQGKVYVNKPKENVIRKTSFVINTNYASYSITGTIFGLDKLTDETLRVLRGAVQADILEVADGKTRTIESIPVGIGQEVVLNDASMKEFYNRQSPSVLTAIDANFETTDWAIWNAKEDENPTNFAKSGSSSSTIGDNQASSDNTVVPVVAAPVDSSTLPAPTLVTPKTNSTSEPDLANNNVAGSTVTMEKPKLLQVDGKPYKEGMSVTKDGFTINGSMVGAAEMWVDDFKLNKFVTGSTTWSYNIKVSYGNLKAGLNSYQVFGKDASGKKSPILTVRFNYVPPVVVAPVTPAATTNPAGASSAAATSAGSTPAAVPAGVAEPVVHY